MVQICISEAGHEEFEVLHATIDQVNLEITVQAADADAAVVPDVEVGTFHERYPQQFRQVTVLEKGGAQLAVGEEHAHGRIGVAQRGKHLKVGGANIVGNNIVTTGKFGKHVETDFGGLHLVGDTGRDPQVVF